jgi:hypothetical protein
MIKVVDWACVFSQEVGQFQPVPHATKLTGVQVKYIWRSRWNHIKVLYLLSRFGPYVDTPLSFISTSAAQRLFYLVLTFLLVYISPDISFEVWCAESPLLRCGVNILPPGVREDVQGG